MNTHLSTYPMILRVLVVRDSKMKHRQKVHHSECPGLEINGLGFDDPELSCINFLELL